MIIPGGFKIHASDIEATLLEHPAIGEAAVIGVPSTRQGGTPLAIVVPSGVCPAPDPVTLADWAKARLGRMQRL